MIRVNGVEEPYGGECIEGLLSRHMVATRGIAVAVDGEVVRRGDWATTVVNDGSSVEIVTAAAGG